MKEINDFLKMEAIEKDHRSEMRNKYSGVFVFNLSS